MKQCSDEQRMAINSSIDKPVAIVACPGSGKTFTIINRIGHLIQSGFQPNELLVITFTRKASQELRERIKSIGVNITNFTVSTFHSFGLSILRKFGHLLNLTKFNIISQSEQIGILQSISDAPFNKEILLKLQIYKTQGLCSDDLAPIFEKYNQQLRSQNSCDYTDLITLPLELLKHNSEVLQYYQRRFKYALVDEMQDVSKVQFDLMKLIFGDRGRLTVVGDDDQTIYSWRGASSRLLLDFSNVYQNAIVIRLTTCFRCPPHIVKSMSGVIQYNKLRVKKVIKSALNEENMKKITVYGATSPKDEAELILNDVERVFGRGSIAILFRTRKAANVIRGELKKRNMGVSFADKARFIETKEVNKVLNILQMLAGIQYNKDYADKKSLKKIYDFYNSMKNDENFLNIKSLKNINKKVAKPIENDMAEEEIIESLRNSFQSISIHDAVCIITSALKLNSSGIESLVKEAKKTEDESFQDFLDSVRTETSEETGQNGIHMSTIHQAKGLEWDYVFLIGATKGSWPQRDCSDEQMEEERRLFYVAMSRAKKDLTISFLKDYGPSVFLDEVPELYVDEKVHIEQETEIDRKPSKSAMPAVFSSVLKIHQANSQPRDYPGFTMASKIGSNSQDIDWTAKQNDSQELKNGNHLKLVQANLQRKAPQPQKRLKPHLTLIEEKTMNNQSTK
ncbi:ATP-dependent DNA helicase Rep [Histomonas meleagridis]|uniref:ATP-dependent DNA helicase Rep n=1 Tax=Histomonas meleagridis TaxID=135588 RepID=UPI003559A58A|nr:ATP-dependent DNA helicase Rep [Histomonas meleagridis]KAH0803512.1 ATP-dependent DNA helicase Rep [Histomonas meleagridis]